MTVPNSIKDIFRELMNVGNLNSTLKRELASCIYVSRMTYEFFIASSMYHIDNK